MCTRGTAMGTVRTVEGAARHKPTEFDPSSFTRLLRGVSAAETCAAATDDKIRPFPPKSVDLNVLLDTGGKSTKAAIR